MLTSGRWLVERDELAKKELMNIPIPEQVIDDKADMGLLERLANDKEFEKREISRILDLYNLEDSEKILIDDTINYTLDYFHRKGKSNAIKPPVVSLVKDYIRLLCNILNNQFSCSERRFIGTVYQSNGPLRMISLKLIAPLSEQIREEETEAEMDRILTDLDHELIEKKAGSIYIRRHMWRYSKDSVYVIKPNQTRFWSKSSAILDADRIYADIMSSWKGDA